MGDSVKKFVEFAVDNAIDAKIVRAGVPAMIQEAQNGYTAAVQALAQASYAGDLEAVAVAKAQIAQYADALEALGQSVAQVNTFDAPAPAPVPVAG